MPAMERQDFKKDLNQYSLIERQVFIKLIIHELNPENIDWSKFITII